MELIQKNMKYHLRSLTFIVFVCVVIVFFVSQFHGSTIDLLAPPEPNQDYYGVQEQVFWVVCEKTKR